MRTVCRCYIRRGPAMLTAVTACLHARTERFTADSPDGARATAPWIVVLRRCIARSDFRLRLD
jgi:hypothetical protein